MPLQKLYDYALQHVNRPKNINNIFFKGVKMSICVKKKKQQQKLNSVMTDQVSLKT